MTHRTTEFAKTVAQLIEFAGFGPCAAVGSVVAVQAFDAVKRYPVMPNLDVLTPVKNTRWRFPSMLTPTTLAVCRIIEDAFVVNGMDEPGTNSTIKIESPDLPFSIEVRYLWLSDPESMQRVVLALLLNQGIPVWASETIIDYQAARDGFLSARVRSLLDTYTSNHPQPDDAILEIIPEILDTVDHL